MSNALKARLEGMETVENGLPGMAKSGLDAFTDMFTAPVRGLDQSLSAGPGTPRRGGLDGLVLRH